MNNILYNKFKEYGTQVTIEKNDDINNTNVSPQSDSVYFLESGLMALMSISKEGEERVYLYFKAPRVIGFTGVLMNALDVKRSKGETSRLIIVAKTKCALRQMREPDFKHYLQSDIQFNLLILQVLTANYIEVLSHFQQAVEENAGTRFCRLLQESYVERDGKKVIPKTMTSLEMSKYLGTHPVTVSRIVSSLKKAGCITKEAGRLVICDEKMLKDFIENGME